MYHLTCTSICCSQPFQPNKSSSGWQPYLKCRRAFDIIYISMRASLFCHATIQSSVRNLAHASLETAVRDEEGNHARAASVCVESERDSLTCEEGRREGRPIIQFPHATFTRMKSMVEKNGPGRSEEQMRRRTTMAGNGEGRKEGTPTRHRMQI